MSHSLLSPLNNPLEVPLALAEALGQEAREEPTRGALKARRPLYQLASRAVDEVAPGRSLCIEKLRGFLLHDTLCYEQPERPELYGQQEAIWRPLRAWARESLGLKLAVARGLEPCAHEEEVMQKATSLLGEKSPLELSGLMGACTLTGSLVIPFAWFWGHLTPEEVFEAAYLEERVQNERWGVEEETEARHRLIKEQLATLDRFFSLLRS